jgi:septal ring-binding cell division protein DamX
LPSHEHETESVDVHGRVSGKINAQAVRIAKSANVQGDITYKTLAIEEHAVLDGQVHYMDAAAKPAVEAKPAVQDAKPAVQEAKPAVAGDAKVETLKPAQAGGGGASGGSGAAVSAKPGGGGKPLAN